jgi:nucleotide-binding universal stress UspA family protein
MNYLDKSKQHLGDNTIQTVIKDGDFGESILDAAKELAADVIVLGTHSRRGLDKILMGSVAEKVFHHSTVPLFIIPTKG